MALARGAGRAVLLRAPCMKCLAAMVLCQALAITSAAWCRLFARRSYFARRLREDLCS